MVHQRAERLNPAVTTLGMGIRKWKRLQTSFTMFFQIQNRCSGFGSKAGQKSRAKYLIKPGTAEKAVESGCHFFPGSPCTRAGSDYLEKHFF